MQDLIVLFFIIKLLGPIWYLWIYLPALSVCVAVDNLCGKKHDSKCFINAGGLRESAVRKGV